MQLEIKVVHHLSPTLEALFAALLPSVVGAPNVPSNLKTDPALLAKMQAAVEAPKSFTTEETFDAGEPAEAPKNKGGRPRKERFADAVPTIAPSTPATTNVASEPAVAGGNAIAPGAVTVEDLKNSVISCAGKRGNAAYLEIRSALGDPNVSTCSDEMRKLWKTCLDAEIANAGAGIVLAKNAK